MELAPSPDVPPLVLAGGVTSDLSVLFRRAAPFAGPVPGRQPSMTFLPGSGCNPGATSGAASVAETTSALSSRRCTPPRHVRHRPGGWSTAPLVAYPDPQRSDTQHARTAPAARAPHSPPRQPRHRPRGPPAADTWVLTAALRQHRQVPVRRRAHDQRVTPRDVTSCRGDHVDSRHRFAGQSGLHVTLAVSPTRSIRFDQGGRRRHHCGRDDDHSHPAQRTASTSSHKNIPNHQLPTSDALLLLSNGEVAHHGDRANRFQGADRDGTL